MGGGRRGQGGVDRCRGPDAMCVHRLPTVLQRQAPSEVKRERRLLRPCRRGGQPQAGPHRAPSAPPPPRVIAICVCGVRRVLRPGSQHGGVHANSTAGPAQRFAAGYVQSQDCWYGRGAVAHGVGRSHSLRTCPLNCALGPLPDTAPAGMECGNRSGRWWQHGRFPTLYGAGRGPDPSVTR